MTFLRSVPFLAARLLLPSFAVWLLSGSAALASEADLAIPDLHEGYFTIAYSR